MKKTSTFTVVILLLLVNLVTKVYGLTDIQGHWGEDYIIRLADSGYINGYEDGTFRPDNDISNAEFTKILVEALKYNVDLLAEDNWEEIYLRKAKEVNILKDGEFNRYDELITRGQIANMIIRAIVDEETPAHLEEYKALIKDYSQLPAQYQKNVLKAYAIGIITGNPDGTFRYNNTATRAEASTMLVRMLDESKRQITELKEIDEAENDIDFVEPEFEIIEKNDFGVLVPAVLISNYHYYDERYSFRGYFNSPYELNFPTRRNLMDFWNDDAIFSLNITESVFVPYYKDQENNHWNTRVDMYNTEAPDHISPEIKMSDINEVEFKIEIKKKTKDGEIIREYIVTAPIHVQ